MQRTCKSCGDTFTWTSTRPNGSGRPAQYCSQRCRNNQPRQCSVCGTTVIRHAADGWRKPNQLVTCSNECRSVVTPGRAGLHSQLPDDHPAKWYGATSDWTPPPPKPARFVAAQCHECGKRFIGDQAAYWSRQANTYCSARCSKRVGKRRRRAREHNAPGEFRWVDVIGLWLALDRCCAYCGAQSDKQPDPDHVVPLSRGGDNTIDNVLPACRPCNTDKRDLTIAEWTSDRVARGKPTLSHPWRAMNWRRTEHAASEPLSA